MLNRDTGKKIRKGPKAKGILLDLSSVYEKLCADIALDSLSVDYLQRRIANEGLSFLTDVLPKFSKCVLASLEAGHWLGLTPEFRLNCDFEHKGALPTFFRSSLSKLFSPKTGTVRKRPKPGCLSNIRQLCEYVYKLSVPYSEEKLGSAIDKFYTIESEVGVDIDWGFVERVRAVGETLWPALTQKTIDTLYNDGRPRFGPGSFSRSRLLCRGGAETLSPAAYKRLPAELVGDCSDSERTFAVNFLPYRHYQGKPVMVNEEKVAEVVFVPKDSRGPRVISKEPLHLLRAQLLFLDVYSEELEKATKGRINFADQSVNRNLAQQSSISRDYATLDLSDASDRVSFRLAANVFRNFPAWSFCLNNYRSTLVIPPSLPTTGSASTTKPIALKKLSGMGSGLTFVTMSALIHLGIVAGICEFSARRTKDALEQVSRQVYVYGDDVIVPSAWYSVAIKSLERLGLRVSQQKSFVKGNFRESCGGDFLLGQAVSPCRMKLAGGGPELHMRLTGKRSSVLQFKDRDGAILALDRHAREMYKAGLWKTANHIWDVVENALGSVLPVVTGESSFIGRWRFKIHYPHNFMEVLNMDGRKFYAPAPVVETHIGLDVHKAYGDSLSRPAPFSIGVSPVERAFNRNSNATEAELKRSFLGHRSWVDFLREEPGPRLSFSEVALPNKIRLVKREAYLHTLNLV